MSTRNMHDCTTTKIRTPGRKRPVRTVLLLTLVAAGLFTLQPLFNLCVQPLHINDQSARDRAYHDRRSTGLSPDPATHPEAVVQIFAARAWGIRGIFADHTWIAFKPRTCAGIYRLPDKRLAAERTEHFPA